MAETDIRGIEKDEDGRILQSPVTGDESERRSEILPEEMEGEEIQTVVERLRNYLPRPEEGIAFYPDYPYPEWIRDKITTSVSEEKKRFTPESVGADSYQAGATNASVRGSLYHKVLVILPWEIEDHELPSFLHSLVDKKKITAEKLAMIDEADMVSIIQSDLWQRMKVAAGNGRLKREQPFILAIPLPSADGEEQKMLQGVIDVFF